MNIAEIVLVIAGVCILAADIAVRLVIAPHNKDRLVEDLLNILHEPHPVSNAVPGLAPTHLPSESLGEGLLRHFTQSWLSCRIVATLAASDAEMRESDIVAEINAVLIESGRRALPEVAVRKVLMILMGADFVTLRHGALSLTALGRHLHSVLDERRRTSPESILAAS